MRYYDVSELGLATPAAYLDIGITGHRSGHPVFSANRDAIAKSLAKLLTLLEQLTKDEVRAIDASNTPRLQMHSLLAYGADIMGVHAATERSWTVAAPLPFGRALNLAINAQPPNLGDMEALLNGGAIGDPSTAQRAAEITAIAE